MIKYFLTLSCVVFSKFKDSKTTSLYLFKHNTKYICKNTIHVYTMSDLVLTKFVNEKYIIDIRNKKGNDSFSIEINLSVQYNI